MINRLQYKRYCEKIRKHVREPTLRKFLYKLPCLNQSVIKSCIQCGKLIQQMKMDDQLTLKRRIMRAMMKIIEEESMRIDIIEKICSNLIDKK